MRQGELNFCLGEDMYEAHKAGKEMPLAADIDAEVDSVELQRLKGIINRATVFDPAKRPSAGRVLELVKASHNMVKSSKLYPCYRFVDFPEIFSATYVF